MTIRRGPLPVPSVTIASPSSLLLFLPSVSVDLEATTAVPTCGNASSAPVRYSWAHTGSAALAGSGANASAVGALALDPATAAQRVLRVSGRTLAAGIRHTLRVRGCLSAGLSGACGEATVDVGLREEPLLGGISGGDRTVSDRAPFDLSACASAYPAESAAPLRFNWSCI